MKKEVDKAKADGLKFGWKSVAAGSFGDTNFVAQGAIKSRKVLNKAVDYRPLKGKEDAI